MKSDRRGGPLWQMAVVFACFLALSISLGLTPSFGETPEGRAMPEEKLRLGERMYRLGVLPSGEPMRTLVGGEAAVPGTTFACASCHLRSGLGAFDEGVYTPPINGSKLFRPLPRFYKGIELNPESVPPLRSAYTEASVTAAIRNGKNPDGRTLNETMPRYLLKDEDAAILVNYLRSLSSRFSPGVTDSTLRLATVISEGAPPAERDAMVASLEAYVAARNSQADYFREQRGAKSRRMAETMLESRELATRKVVLSRWLLKGAPETWRGQLEEYLRKEPVFALVGGVVEGEWRPIHDFCEENRIPCLFPNTDLPVVSDTAWYTVYLTKGYYQEGESVARFLDGREDAFKGRPVVQIVRDSPEGDALGRGFQETWHHLGHQAPVTVALARGEELGTELLDRVLNRERPTVLLLWDGPGLLAALHRLADRKERPEMVFVSSRYLGTATWPIGKRVRDFTYLTYPFALPPSEDKGAMGKQGAQGDRRSTVRQGAVPLNDRGERMTGLTNSLTRLLTLTLMDMKGNYYRDHFIDVIGMMKDQPYPLYGRVGFGQGQRYAARGCFIVQLSGGDDPELVTKSGWETP